MVDRLSSIPPEATLQPGAVVGGRFTIERSIGAATFGHLYEAVDDRSKKRSALRLIPAGLVRDAEDAERIRAEVRLASGLVHRNIVGTHGLGGEPNGDLFLTMEYVEGQNLEALLALRAASGKRFSLRGAFNVAAHVCNALQHAHEKSILHGALSPHDLLVTRTGRVKVANFALSRLLPTLIGVPPARRTSLLAYLAPEVRSRAHLRDGRADVFSTAVVLFELLGGKARPGIVPSTASLGPAVPPPVRAILDAALAHDPAARPATAKEFQERLSAELQKLGEIEPADDDLGLDIDVSMAPPKPGAPAMPPKPPPHRPPPAPMVAPRESQAGALLRAAAQAARSSAAPPAPAPPARTPGGPPPPPAATPDSAAFPKIESRPSSVDFGAVLNQLDADDAERWMLQKDKLDHGPFRDRELAEMILKGDALPEHAATNLETGVRCKLRDIEPFQPFLEKYRVRKKKAEEAAAIQHSVRVERMGLAAKVAIAAGIALALGGAAVGLYYGLRPDTEDAKRAQDDLSVAQAGPKEVDGVQEKMSEAELEPLPPPDAGTSDAGTRSGRRGGSRRGGGSSRRGSGGLQDWEKAWNEGGNLDIDSEDNVPILRGSDITAKMRQNKSQLFGCVRAEMGRNPGMPTQINIEMLIRGREIVAARVPGQSSELEQCIQGVLGHVVFDAQAYGQMRSTFSMEVAR